jgi:hypothetical protein
MSNKRKPGVDPNRMKKPAFRFINYSLTVADKDWLQACDVAVEFPLSRFVGLVQEGYKVSLSEDAKNHSVVASMTDMDPMSIFWNACLTGRGKTVEQAVASLLYRHLIIADTEWGVFGADPTTAVDEDFG